MTPTTLEPTLLDLVMWIVSKRFLACACRKASRQTRLSEFASVRFPVRVCFCDAEKCVNPPPLLPLGRPRQVALLEELQPEAQALVARQNKLQLTQVYIVTHKFSYTLLKPKQCYYIQVDSSVRLFSFMYVS